MNARAACLCVAAALCGALARAHVHSYDSVTLSIAWFSWDVSATTEHEADVALKSAQRQAGVTVVSLPQVSLDVFNAAVGAHAPEPSSSAAAFLALTRERLVTLDTKVPSDNVVTVAGADEEAVQQALRVASDAVRAAQSSDAHSAVIVYVGSDVRRSLQATGSPIPSPSATPRTTAGIRITPEVIAGLVISLFLAAAVSVGLSCVMTVATPDMLHSTTLPAGKEY